MVSNCAWNEKRKKKLKNIVTVYSNMLRHYFKALESLFKDSLEYFTEI